MEEQSKKSKLFGIESPKVTFVLGLMSGITIFGLIAFILLLISFPQQKVGTLTEQKNEQKNEQQQQIIQQPQPQGMEAKIVGSVGTFYEVDEPICKKNGKPLVYMFSTSWCPHCQWARPLFENVVKDYVKQGKIVAYQWELDTNDNTLTATKETAVDSEDMAIYEKYNPQGSIPTFVFGCKYFRIGTGHERTQDKAAEEKEFREIIDKLLK